MTPVFDAVDSQWVLLLAAIALIVLASRLIFRILSVGLGPMLGILAIVLGLQYLFGIPPKQLWFEVSHLPQMAMKLWQSLT
ncbi:MAG TPA: hypothetical protein IGR64_02630 [Leptolyngbyaceae cyanobacterium M65_K2018_010]|nr:hypothetical protein [Leptolyngbyaceae cyanobacterium M65_K2018_010]